MKRRAFVNIIVLFAMLWQTAAAAHLGGAISEFSHAVMHWQSESHHHHDDGSSHPDESTESARHMAIDHSGASPAIASSFTHAHVALPPSASATLCPLDIPCPTLSGPFRPPRSRA